MNLYIRLLLLKLRFMLHRKPAGSIEDEFLMSFVCGLSDIDLYMHMNNSRYLAFMDLGRIHFIRSIGALEQIQKQGWLTIVGGVEMQYRRPVGLFQRFQLKTRILCWDEKWFYYEQVFWVEGKVAAVGRVRGLLMDKDKNLIPSARILELIGSTTPSPALPIEIERWNSMSVRPNKVAVSANSAT